LGLDWLRIAAFALLILYHIGMIFAPGHWVVKAPVIVEAADWPMLAVQPWRMSLLFAVSGYASFMLMQSSRGMRGFAAQRSYRLLLPLAFGLCLLVPPQSWVELTIAGQYRDGFWQFMRKEWLIFRPADDLPQFQHLWFLLYLWTYTMILSLAAALLGECMVRRLVQVLEWIGQGRRLLWAPLVLLLPARVMLLFTVPEEHGLLHDWVSDLLYIPSFLLGLALAARPQLWRPVIAARPFALPLACACYVLLLLIDMRYPSGEVSRPHLIQAGDRLATLTMAWSVVLLLFGFAHSHWNREHPWRRRLSQAIFPCYLVHQTIIILVAWLLLDSGLSNGALFATLVVATVSGCWAFTVLGGQIAWLRPFIGLGHAHRTRRKITSTLIPAE
jgi:hypothetical protein